MDQIDWDNLEGPPKLEHVRHGDFDLRVGDQVRLCPKSGADVMDIALKGKLATIEAIEQDYEARIHLAVVVNDDPGRDFGLLRKPGHRFFYSLDEIEPIPSTEHPRRNDE